MGLFDAGGDVSAGWWNGAAAAWNGAAAARVGHARMGGVNPAAAGWHDTVVPSNTCVTRRRIRICCPFAAHSRLSAACGAALYLFYTVFIRVIVIVS